MPKSTSATTRPEVVACDHSTDRSDSIANVPDDFTVENDGTSQQQRSVGELTPLVMGLDLERHGREDPLHARVGGSLESGELIAILGPDCR